MEAIVVREQPVKPPVKEVVVKLSAREAQILRMVVADLCADDVYNSALRRGVSLPIMENNKFRFGLWNVLKDLDLS